MKTLSTREREREADIGEGKKNSETAATLRYGRAPRGPRGTSCKISHKDRRPCTIMAPELAGWLADCRPYIPRDLVGDRYDEALAVAACLVLRV